MTEQSDAHVDAYRAYRTALAIASIGRGMAKAYAEPRRNSAYYEESHRLHQAQLLKR